MYKYFITLFLYTLSFLAHSQIVDQNDVDLNNIAGGNAYKFSNKKLAASNTPHVLPIRLPATKKEKDIIRSAHELIDNNPTLVLLLIDKGQIVFEKYKHTASRSSPMFSYSMSKSLTAYTIGYMHCDKTFFNLNTPASTYSNELLGTVYGEASIRDLLMMAGGGVTTHPSGHSRKNAQKHNNEWYDMRSRKMSTLDNIQEHRHRDKSFFGTPVKSGEVFNYSNNDTSALANIADNNGGLINNFEKNIWSKINAEYPSYWMLAKDDRPIAFAGFSATGRDWGKLAMHTIKELKNEDQCISGYMKDATSKQIENKSRRTGAFFDNYGYQTWATKISGRDTYWMLGFGGQRVGVDPAGERIMVIFSYREDYMPKIYKLFSEWISIDQ